MAFLTNVCVFLIITCPLCLARHTTSYSDLPAGSGDGEGLTQSHDLINLTTEGPGSFSNGTSNHVNIFDRITKFLKEYMLLAIVVGTLIILLIFVVCGAIIMSHKHKASAYYPSSFSQKEYVNHNDKSGGAKAFNEIPEKAQDAKAEEVVDSSKQLQADILNAAQNLKSPTKGGSSKEEHKIIEEPKDPQVETTTEDNKGDTNDNTKQDSSSQEVEEIPGEQTEETKPTDCPEEPSGNLAEQENQEKAIEIVDETNPTPCDPPPAENSTSEEQQAQESPQQPPDTCGV
ncbi:hypothetical protein XENTR_v10002228 [Xenopus tropicalis]|uniref:Transmembrane protein 119 n=1 Tax=Xenopus tropicalis TaxID=8364 RepID=A0A803K9D6_XENTR|nr:transmembrane protein 119 [Xenopus tropicalis]KAE8634205.1 hypothetical protein XENTR_v10002228 [Xenopus tropicalis]|eukprot:XP_002939236.1 PREDICTED: transmembrane protein 119 [Xenopus tropicalis]